MLLVTLTWRTHIKNTLVWVMRIGSVYCRQVWKFCWHWAFKKYFSCEWKTRWKESLVLLGIMWNQYNKERLNKRKKNRTRAKILLLLIHIVLMDAECYTNADGPLFTSPVPPYSSTSLGPLIMSQLRFPGWRCSQIATTYKLPLDYLRRGFD